ncbi:flavodoxin family protein [Salinimonas iocasae]|uniref:Flavodoxin family protein n=1 Tax=Salinimonas iocasae TaxID=2572577 RepID=A0A5B7YHU5_9ALTE|nr:flavodoxin family protein [Salinimonas iocasae]QCZ94900.1 flavodoxin family protein [Salinimonas iocasae]
MKIAVVFHSGYGHTKRLANAFFDELEQHAAAQNTLIEIDENGDITDGQWSVLDDADAIIFGSPTYMGMASWQFKKFADESSKRWFEDKWRNKVAGGFTNSGSMNGDKHSTLHYFVTLAGQHGMIWANMGMKPANTNDADRNDVNYVGAFIGLMAQSPIDADADEAPCQGDLDTAKAYAKRVLEVTEKWVG